MWASMSAQSDGQTLRIYAALLDGSSFVSLDTGDVLTASIGGNDVVLVREPNDAPGDVHYTRALPAPAAETPVAIALTRPTGRISAPSSQVSVASGFSITSSPPLAIHRGDLLSVTSRRSRSSIPTPRTIA